MRPLKNRYPFRLGATSYVICGNLVENARYLSELVDDMEVVLFDQDGFSNIPSPDEIKQLGEISRESGLTYTVHLPMDTKMASTNAEIRRKSIDQNRRIIDLFSPTEPFAYVVHLDGDMRGQKPADDIPLWQNLHFDAMNELTALAPAEKFAVETIDYPYTLISDLVNALGLRVCMDIGHLLMCNYSVNEHFTEYLPKTSVLHIHGIINGEDHNTVAALPASFLSWVISELKNHTGIERVLSMEVFESPDFESSLEAVRGIACKKE